MSREGSLLSDSHSPLKRMDREGGFNFLRMSGGKRILGPEEKDGRTEGRRVLIYCYYYYSLFYQQFVVSDARQEIGFGKLQVSL